MNAFEQFAKRLKEALGATEGTGDFESSDWRVFLTLPGGEKLFVRLGARDRADIHPMIDGKIPDDKITAGTNVASQALTANRIQSLFSETGKWGKMQAAQNERDAANQEREAARVSVKEKLEARGWTAHKQPTGFLMSIVANGKTLRAQIDHEARISLLPLDVTLSQLEKIRHSFD